MTDERLIHDIFDAIAKHKASKREANVIVVHPSVIDTPEKRARFMAECERLGIKPFPVKWKTP